MTHISPTDPIGRCFFSKVIGPTFHSEIQDGRRCNFIFEKICLPLEASEGKLSDFFVSNVGVRQGGNLSPLLFCIYVDDLENYLSTNGSVPLEVDKMFNTENVLKLLVLLYADDTQILADSPENLQISLHNLSLYCEKWHLTVNETKTKIMIFSKRKFKHRSTFYYANKKV